MIKVLHVVGKMHYGGMETLIMNIYRSIDRSKFQFDFIVHYKEKGEYDNEIEQLGGKIFVLPDPVLGNFFLLKRAYENFFVMHREYQCIHVHLHKLAFMLFPPAKKFGIYCIMHLHNSGIEFNLKGYLGLITTKLAVPMADTIFVCSEKSAEYYCKKYSFVIIKNGIYAEKFYFDIGIRNKVRSELGLNEKFVLLCAARFSIQKNHEFLIDIVSELKKTDPEVRLLLVGTGPLEETIRRKVKRLHLEDNVMFLGARGDVNELMQAADCFVMPSLSEGLALTYIEAQAAGLKVYTSGEALAEAACITDLIEGIPLSDPPAVWAEKIYTHRKYTRCKQREALEDSGFDIHTSTAFLEQFYRKLQNT